MIDKYKRIKNLKRFVAYEFDPKYVDSDRITLHNVRLKETVPSGSKKPLRTVLIKTLVVLNTEESEEATINIKKAVIDPSTSREKLSHSIHKELFH